MSKNVQIIPASGSLDFIESSIDGTQSVVLTMKKSGTVAAGIDISINGSEPVSIQGIQGVQGIQGITGAQGIQGIQGVTGISPAYINFFDYTSGSTTNFASADDYEPLAMVATVGFTENGLSVNSSGVVNYTGATSAVFRVSGIVSGSTGTGNELSFAFFTSDGVTDTLIPCSEQSVVASTGRATAVPFHCLVELNGVDENLRVFVKNKSGTTSFELENVNVIVEKMK